MSDPQDKQERRTRQIDPQIALELLARHMWIADCLERLEDGIEAAMQWDRDELLIETYERFGAIARDAVVVETKRRSEEDLDARYAGEREA